MNQSGDVSVFVQVFNTAANQDHGDVFSACRVLLAAGNTAIGTRSVPRIAREEHAA